ncbi:hypothetical protein [Glycomyces sp. NPDC048151]|uniref:hypothetical protein n=1 Tax=Glycomyces sp. NPDC048151 TaxID=3364002 RepID=UPI00371CDE8A
MIPALLAALCDDAAVFPPGNAPLAYAVRAYGARRRVWYADLAGPLVLPAAALPRLAPLLPRGDAPLPLSVTFPDGPAGVAAALAHAAALPVELRSIEVAVPGEARPAAFLEALAATLDDAPELDVYVEIPRGLRQTAFIEAVAGRYRAKFRTGGVRAELYPDEAELAGAVAAAVAVGLPFKATAGLHHAIRNTDRDTGFEQHGFLNLLAATDALASGVSEREARALLAERDGHAVASWVRGLDESRARRAREAFLSFGTCSITDPLNELTALGLVTAPARTEGSTS